MAALPLAGATEGGEWVQALPRLAPALRACLAGDRAAFVTAAEPQPDGLLLLRVHRGGIAEECLARPSGEVVGRQARPEAPPPDPAAPAFFLERRCVDARRVETGEGRVLGWLAYPAC
jgi:hypothetical protein